MAFAPFPNAFDTESSLNGSRHAIVKFTAGTAGAAPSSLTRGKEYVSSTTKSTNDYVLALRNKWAFLGSYNVQVRQASFSAAGACYGTVSVDNVAGSTPSVTISFYKGSDGTAVALATGDVVTIDLELSNVQIAAI